MKMSVYLPDDLHERVKAAEGLNVSSILQSALEVELNRRDRVAELGRDVQEVELFVDRGGSGGREIVERTVVFAGRQVAYCEHAQISGMQMSDVAVYLTPKGRFAVVGVNSRGTLFSVFDDLDALKAAVDDDTYAQVAYEFGDPAPLRLDI